MYCDDKRIEFGDMKKRKMHNGSGMEIERCPSDAGGDEIRLGVGEDGTADDDEDVQIEWVGGASPKSFDVKWYGDDEYYNIQTNTDLISEMSVRSVIGKARRAHLERVYVWVNSKYSGNDQGFICSYEPDSYGGFWLRTPSSEFVSDRYYFYSHVAIHYTPYIDEDEEAVSPPNAVESDTAQLTIGGTFQPVRRMVFENSDGEVGRLEWSDGKMVFTGDADEAATEFVCSVIGKYATACQVEDAAEITVLAGKVLADMESIFSAEANKNIKALKALLGKERS